MSKMNQSVIGVDYGTDSVRTVVVNVRNGQEVSSAVFKYPRWKKGQFCDPSCNQFRQHPLDYLEGLEYTIKQALKKAPKGTAARVVGLSVATTGSTPVAVDIHGTPLALLPEFQDNPNAMFVLWKDHAGVKEAGEINALAKSWGGTDFTCYSGETYSAEWFWAKILHALRADAAVAKKAFSWVEHCDWVTALLTGNTDPLKLKRSRCAAGHKAMWHPSFGGLPAEEFLAKLDPCLKGLRERLYEETYTSDTVAGVMCPEWANKLGLPETVKVGVGAFDAHIGAVGGGITSGVLLKIMGTSTCDMAVATPEEISGRLVKGICGQVDGSIVPGLIGLEAGQSAFGDVYAWFRDLLAWPLMKILAKNKAIPARQRRRVVQETIDAIIEGLSKEAAELPLDESGALALDWHNGRRTPDANQLLKGAIAGLTLGTDAPLIFRALVEATAFGSLAIRRRFEEEGVDIGSVIAVGGIAKKSPFVMQTVADVLGMPIQVPKAEQLCALGAAMFAATVAGVYPNVPAAMKAMRSPIQKTYHPNKGRAAAYKAMYERYLELGGYAEQLAAADKQARQLEARSAEGA